jgi:hypothetical protein
LIKIVSADNKVTEDEKESLGVFLNLSDMKISNSYYQAAKSEPIKNIVDAFTSKGSLISAASLLNKFAKFNRINPEFEGKVLKEIFKELESKRKNLKFGIGYWVNAFFHAFAFLWGQEDINPTIKKILAIVFTAMACFFGSFWTESSWLFWKETSFVMPQFSAVIAGLCIYLALAVRNFMPRPNNFSNISFTLVDVYLLSLMSMHIIGRGDLEKTLTLGIFFGLILLLWLGIKELIGFFVIAIFILFLIKINYLDIHIGWRAYVYVITAFLGFSFQSDNFFDEVSNITNSYIKVPAIEKDMIKESIIASGKSMAKAGMKAGSIAMTAARKGVTGGI